jgi:hypothetical protein
MAGEKMSPVGKSVAEHILDIVRLIREDVVELRKQIGDEAMEPVDRRLKRLEAKLHSHADGTWGKHDDGMDARL